MGLWVRPVRHIEPWMGEPLTVLEKAVLGGIEQKKKNLLLFPEVSKNVL